ncbi:acyltransferase [Clostridium butyricum]|uniref:acyltransferase n=1 Tax=Clostridium butyricum TaxID=1492 RepID=UPI003D33E142
MINRIRNIIKKIYMHKLTRLGLKVGENFQMEKGCQIDTPFAWLINIGNNVTLASKVYILAHDASCKKHIGYTKIGKVNIGNNVFIGANSTILPNVSIGDNSIIGANSLVSKDVPENTIVAGNPAKIIDNLELFIDKNKERMQTTNLYDESWTLRGKVTKEKKRIMVEQLQNKFGYID